MIKLQHLQQCLEVCLQTLTEQGQEVLALDGSPVQSVHPTAMMLIPEHKILIIIQSMMVLKLIICR